MRFWALRGAAALSAALSLLLLGACGGGNNSVNKPTQVVLTPTTLSLNEGAVQGLSAVAESASGGVVAADITFTSSNTSIATVSTGGLICAGVWDSSFINCTPTIGQGGVGQVTITATATAFNLSATATVYVHLHVDQVQAVLGSSCFTSGQAINISGLAFSTTAPGCSPSAPCDITSTVGPFTFGSNDPNVASSSSGINPTFSSTTNTPTYVSGGTITGSKGQTCNLSNFNGLVGAVGTVALTGTNAIAGGTQLTITAPGHGATVAPTTAMLSNGTATCSGTATVSTQITSGVFTAEVPGATTVFASVSGVNGVGTPYLTCPVHSIVVHDANTSNTTFTLAPSGTQALTADVYDTNNQYITAPITWGSSATQVATAVAGASGNNPGTVTGVHGGTAYITATCSYPDCNRNVDTQYSQNVVTVNVTTPSATTVYAAGTNSTTLVPINTATNATGTPITLPYTPNSILASPDGGSLYLGSSSALMGVSVSTGAVTPVAAGAGTVVAISPDSLYLLISNSAGNLVYFNTSTAAVTGTAPGTSVASAFTPDSKFNAALLANTNLLEYGPQTGPVGTMTLASNGTALDISGTGSLTYITSASGAQIFVYSTCNVTPTAQVFTATSPTLIKSLPNATGAVATGPPNLDVITTPAMLNAGCPITTQSTINSYDLGAGSFTARQVLVSTDATHAYILSDLPQLLSFDLATLAPASVPLIGGANALSGGITVDGSRIYVGTSDVTVHEIDTASMTDAGRIEVGLKDANGNPTFPNLVAVVP
jgi:hypothetical protein